MMVEVIQWLAGEARETEIEYTAETFEEAAIS